VVGGESLFETSEEHVWWFNGWGAYSRIVGASKQGWLDEQDLQSLNEDIESFSTSHDTFRRTLSSKATALP
jgi:hypothetical protein